MKERQLTFREERKNLDQYLEIINQNRHPISLLLDRVDDARNVGSIFRMADAARIERIYGFQIPDPMESKLVYRVSRSASRYIPYTGLTTLEEIKALKKEAQLLALEITNKSISYTEFVPKGRCILVIGQEKDGVSEEILQLVDQSLHIPMYGVNTSMNVSVATGIVVFDLLEKIRSLKGKARPDS